MTLLQITAPHFCAGVVVGVEAAPIVRYMTRWNVAQIRSYCARKRWQVVEIVEPGEGADA